MFYSMLGGLNMAIYIEEDAVEDCKLQIAKALEKYIKMFKKIQEDLKAI